MGYFRFTPTRQLSDYVESIWVQEDSRSDPTALARPTRILPTTKTDFALFYGDPFVQLEQEREVALPRVALTGQSTRPVDLRATGKTGVLLVGFRPWGAFHFFGIPMGDLTDSHLALDSIIPRRLRDELIERVTEARTARAKVEIVESFLCERLDSERPDALIVEAARKANAAFGRVSVGQLAAEVRMCRRHLGRRFRAVIGLPPKTFARIIRFQKALFFKRSGLSWNEIVQLCDYSDQSHFIKEIKRFSDYPPEAILNARTPSPLTRFFNGRPDMSHFYNTTYL